jgi:hypothetical protein
MGKWVRRNSGFILWIVPNDAIYDPATTVTCALVYQEHWQTDLAGIMRE